MPNWCNNQMTISHNDPAMIERAVKAWNDGEGFLEEFIPIPYELKLVGGALVDIRKITNHDHHRELDAMVRELNKKYFGFPDWYDYCCSEWGTKWDIGHRDGYGTKAELEGNSFTVGFDSAWSPPIAAYEKLTEMGFKIKAYYTEFGMQFCGRWDDGEDESFKIPDTSEEAEKVIPVDIDRVMNIVETVSNYEEMNHA